MKVNAVQNILDNMCNTDDPIQGAVFEKKVETTLEDFCLFILSSYNHVTMERRKAEDGNEFFTFYDGNRAENHIGTYIPFKKTGLFGGIRVGSKNPMRKPGDPDVKEPFNPDEYNFEYKE